ncbi:MAG: hypothetical protein AB1432_06310 [Bacteroidota bacterium]
MNRFLKIPLRTEQLYDSIFRLLNPGDSDSKQPKMRSRPYSINETYIWYLPGTIIHMQFKKIFECKLFVAGGNILKGAVYIVSVSGQKA